MSRNGLLIVLAIAAAVGLFFGLRSDLDLAISLAFFDSGAKFFPLRWVWPVEWLRYADEMVMLVFAGPAVVALIVKLVAPSRPMLIPGRAAIFLLATLVLGPGLLVNGVLKSEWPRPRPVPVAEKVEPFVAWWDLRGTCRRNCSFVSGETATAFWTLAPASLAPPAWRPLAYAGAILFGIFIGAFRVAIGAHFASDVFFAGVFAFLVVWLVHGLIYRWPRTRITDDAVERRLERIALYFRNLATRPPR